MATAMVRKLRPRTINRRPSRLAGLRLAWEFHDLGTLPEDPLQTANDKPPGTVDAAFTTHPRACLKGPTAPPHRVEQDVCRPCTGAAAQSIE